MDQLNISRISGIPNFLLLLQDHHLQLLQRRSWHYCGLWCYRPGVIQQCQAVVAGVIPQMYLKIVTMAIYFVAWTTSLPGFLFKLFQFNWEMSTGILFSFCSFYQVWFGFKRNVKIPLGTGNIYRMCLYWRICSMLNGSVWNLWKNYDQDPDASKIELPVYPPVLYQYYGSGSV
jgi:hypothetical protein